MISALLGDVDFQCVRFGAGIEAGCASDASFALVNHWEVAASIQFSADFKHFLGAGVNTTSAGFAFQWIDEWIRFRGVHGFRFLCAFD